MNNMKISGQIVDVVNRRIFPGNVHISNGIIQEICETPHAEDQFILPGLIDGHIHIESSMLVPSEFARLATVHGTVATVSDPHEIANIMGIRGIDFMINNANSVPFKFFFGAPSCVPATPFETSGAIFGLADLDNLLQKEEILYLSEMMNVPGILSDNDTEIGKINIANKYGKKVDGHAPGLRNADAKKYVQAGISTDHECVNIDEAREKIKYGMTVQIREGSATRDLDALMPLIDEHPDQIMFCSDDRHPDDLVDGHINLMVKRSIKHGYDIFNILQAATINPIKHYGLTVGMLQVGDSADLITVDNLEVFNIQSTYINGQIVAQNGKPLLKSQKVDPLNNFNTKLKRSSDFAVPVQSGKLKVIEVIDGQIITKSILVKPKVRNGFVLEDIENDILKISVINRYKNDDPAVAFINNFGIKNGAIASSVAHDSHNIIAVGTSDDYICQAVNTIIESKGGICLINNDISQSIPLPIAGVMTDADGYLVAKQYAELDILTKKMGSTLKAPFMTLSFMALLVVPDLKISDKGLFDGKKFELTNNFTLNQ